jgi:DnaD/phage-associated family protein
MPNVLYFPTHIGLLTPEHRERIGSALWEFLWFISKTTREFQEGEELLGIVLGGVPIKYIDIAKDLGASESTVKKHVAKLKKYQYIESKRTPYGEIYYVKNSKKFKKNRQTKNGLSENERQTKNDLSEDRDRPKMVERQTKNGLCNKDIKDIKEKDIKDDDMNNPFKEYEIHFGFPTPMLIEDFNYWIDKSQYKEPEVIICEVIKRAKLQSPRNPAKYVSKILEDLHRMELFTLEAVKQHNEKFDKKVKVNTKNHQKHNEIDWGKL